MGDHHDNTPGLISTTYPGTWFGIWDAGTYSVAREAQDIDGTGPLEDTAIPGGTYAVFRTGYGCYAGDELPRLRAQIFEAWLGGSGFRQTRDYEVEVYHLMPKAEKAKRYYEIWVPVERCVL